MQVEQLVYEVCHLVFVRQTNSCAAQVGEAATCVEDSNYKQKFYPNASVIILSVFYYTMFIKYDSTL